MVDRSARGDTGRKVWLRVLKTNELGVFVALLLLGLILSFTTHNLFLTSENLLKVARQSSPYGIMAVGMVFVIVLGEIDLSVGSIYMLANVVAALALHANVAVPAAIAAGLAVGLIAGTLNGILSVALGIPTIIVTIGTMSVFRGIGLVACNATPVSDFKKDNAFFTEVGGSPFGVPAGILAMLVVAVIGWIWLNRSIAGRRVQAIGGNPVAGRLSGLSVNKYRIGVMAMNGLIASVAGLMALAFSGSADPNDGQGFELWVIASAIIGGTALQGGSGSVTGAILGALMIAVIRNGLVLLSAPTYMYTAVIGAVIIIAVAIDALIKRQSRRRT